jgi:hypothetical protein
MAEAPDNADPVKKAILFGSEYLVPGGSNLVQGDIKTGAVHAVLGLAAKSMFGLPGLLVVSANSFSKALTGHNLYEHLGLMSSKPLAPPPPTRPGDDL